jgi:hypothetical protein
MASQVFVSSPTCATGTGLAGVLAHPLNTIDIDSRTAISFFIFLAFLSATKHSPKIFSGINFYICQQYGMTVARFILLKGLR